MSPNDFRLIFSTSADIHVRKFVRHLWILSIEHPQRIRMLPNGKFDFWHITK